jgi:diguanylate cyclase (GGDEF)-like protein
MFGKYKRNLIERYILLTTLVVWSLILLIPVIAYILTGKKAYLSPEHFLLTFIVGLIQVSVINKILKKDFQTLVSKISETLKEITEKIKQIKNEKDIDEIYQLKEKKLKTLLEEEAFGPLVRNFDKIFDEVLKILEIKLMKESFIRKLTTTLNSERISNILLNNLIRKFNFPAGAIYLKENDTSGFILKSNKGFKTQSLDPFLSESFLSKVEELDNVFLFQLDLECDYGIFQTKVKDVMVVKLNPRKDKVIGFIFLALSQRNLEDLEHIKTFWRETLTPISLIFENAIEHEKSLMLAKKDPLTGALNRREGVKLINILLKRAEFNGTNVCFILLDLDNFKKINDTYGHDIGDLVLKEVVKAVKSSIRSEDLVIRWGGEEFMVVVSGVPSSTVVNIAERIRKNVEKIEIKLSENRILRPTVSVGVACTEKEKTFSLDELFKVADERLYKAKERGKNRVVAED